VPLSVVGLVAAYRFLGGVKRWILSDRQEASDVSPVTFSEVLKGIRWMGRRTPEGEVLDLIPYCPHCGLQLQGIGEVKPFTWERVSHFRCEDCEGTRVTLQGNRQQIENLIARLIEAQWRRKA
ncbi:MAG TPA: hypothetical protein VJ570_05905, partial [Holophagaceae bacterium]|nr:hypothetical protein [Holophagaceae bacterium]